MKLNNAFNSVSFVWGILKRYLPDTMVNSMRGMRMFKDNKGVAFDVPDESIDKFEDTFKHLLEEKKIDFYVGRAKELPELKEDIAFP
jgi:hypothetical protein